MAFPSIDAMLKAYGSTCATAASASTAAASTSGQGFCSRTCSLTVAKDSKDVDAFCIVTATSPACFGSIVTGGDTDDEILEPGTRSRAR